MSFSFQNILIYGLGLMGASIALGLRKRAYTGKITGIVRSEKSRQIALEKMPDLNLYLEDSISDMDFSEYDLVILATPVNCITNIICKSGKRFKGIVTDLGSVKKSIIDNAIREFSDEKNFISSHPMAGSEHSGPGNGNPDLYEGKLCIVTEVFSESVKIRERLEDFWKFLGSKIIYMDPLIHDRILAYLSHTPHILSSLLVNWAMSSAEVKKGCVDSEVPLTGGGFRDMSRIAGSNPEMWNAILSENSENVLNSLESFHDQLGKLIQEYKNGGKYDQYFWEKYFQDSAIEKSRLFKLG